MQVFDALDIALIGFCGGLALFCGLVIWITSRAERRARRHLTRIPPSHGFRDDAGRIRGR